MVKASGNLLPWDIGDGYIQSVASSINRVAASGSPGTEERMRVLHAWASALWIIAQIFEDDVYADSSMYRTCEVTPTFTKDGGLYIKGTFVCCISSEYLEQYPEVYKMWSSGTPCIDLEVFITESINAAITAINEKVLTKHNATVSLLDTVECDGYSNSFTVSYDCVLSLTQYPY